MTKERKERKERETRRSGRIESHEKKRVERELRERIAGTEFRRPSHDPGPVPSSRASSWLDGAVGAVGLGREKKKREETEKRKK